MTDRRRGLGRGLGALIPSGAVSDESRPVDVYFSRGDGPRGEGPAAPALATPPPGYPDADLATFIQEPNERVVSGERTTPGAGTTRGEHTEPWEDPEPGLVPVPGARFAEIPVDALAANPRQPRTVFDDDELAELTFSIKEIGILQPVVVRPRGDGGYELVMGERRVRAAKAAGLDRIPAIIRETDDMALLRDALLENLHRSQLNPLEEAAAYRQLLDDFACTQEELAARIGRSRPQVSNTLRLLRLPPLVARRVAAGVLSAGHARALLGLSDGAAMERLSQRIVAEGLSVRSVEEIVALGDEQERPERRRAPSTRRATPEFDELASSLSDFLDTRASIVVGKNKGKVTIEFAGVDDLRRILDAIGLRPPTRS